LQGADASNCGVGDKGFFAAAAINFTVVTPAPAVASPRFRSALPSRWRPRSTTPPGISAAISRSFAWIRAQRPTNSASTASPARAAVAIDRSEVVPVAGGRSGPCPQRTLPQRFRIEMDQTRGQGRV
jgi:hypothetical protein